MAPQCQINRRKFLKTGTQLAGGLILGFHLPASGETQKLPGAPRKTFKPNAWLRISAHNQVPLLVEKPELGQGSRAYTPKIIAEELDVDCSVIQAKQAPTIPAVYRGLRTTSSGGVASTFTPVREARAHAGELLLTAANQQWQVKRADCRAKNGTVVHDPTNRRFTYGELVDVPSQLPLISSDEITLSPPKDFRVIGKPIPRTDIPSKVDCSAACECRFRRQESASAVLPIDPQLLKHSYS